jgi:hypothetical protein
VTFVGEAQSPWVVYALPGGDFVAGLEARGEGAAPTLDGGDDLIMSFRSYDYLEATDVAVFQLVFVVLSGSASVRVTYGANADFEYDAASCTETAGTFTMSTGDTEVDLPVWTVPAYHAMDEMPLVRVEILSGTIELDQIRLRIWPPGGYGGGWSDTVTPTVPVGPIPQTVGVRHEPIQAYTTDPPGMIGATRVSWPEPDADREEAFTYAQTLARNDLNAADQAVARTVSWNLAFGDWVVSTGGGAYAYPPFLNMGVPEGATATAVANTERTYIEFSTGEQPPDGDEGVDWVRHPDRTELDDDATHERLGDPTWEWAQGVISWQIRSTHLVDGEARPLTGSYYFSAEFTDTEPPPATYDPGLLANVADWSPVVAGTLIATVTGSDEGEGELPPNGEQIELPPITAPYLVLEASHSVAFGELPPVAEYGHPTGWVDAGAGFLQVYGGTFTTLSALTRTDYAPISYYVTRAPYRYWSPTTQPVRHLRQKNRDSIRARNRASRQRGIRARGYY